MGRRGVEEAADEAPLLAGRCSYPPSTRARRPWRPRPRSSAPHSDRRRQSSPTPSPPAHPQRKVPLRWGGGGGEGRGGEGRGRGGKEESLADAADLLLLLQGRKGGGGGGRGEHSHVEVEGRQLDVVFVGVLLCLMERQRRSQCEPRGEAIGSRQRRGGEGVVPASPLRRCPPLLPRRWR